MKRKTNATKPRKATPAKPKRKTSKPAAAPSLARQVLAHVRPLNFHSEYTDFKTGEQVIIHPLNERADLVVFKHSQLSSTQTEIEMYVSRKGERFHSLSLIIETGSKAEGAVLAIAKSELKRLC